MAGPDRALRSLEHMLLDENAEPANLPLSLLSSITNNFSDDQQLGRDEFAAVYKGVLPSGTAVSVKSLFESGDSDERFVQDVVSLTRVKHRNIIRFLGYYFNTEGRMLEHEGKLIMADVRKRLLCFEYLPNGSLDKHISDESCGLDWRTRYEIIKGICEGLHYLHQQRIVHLDIKPGNVLLDDHMVPKIIDFGCSWFFDENRRQKITTETIIDSIGYLAPEFSNGVITSNLDIYALGVLIAEILTGRKGYSSVADVLEGWRNRLGTPEGDIPLLEQVRVCAEICRRCMDCNPKKRPDMEHLIEIFSETDRIKTTQDTQRIIEMLNVTESMGKSMELNNILERIVDGSEEPKYLDLSLLQNITGYFNKKRRIGFGGCGEVYKGTLQNGAIVAVKRLFKSSTIKDKMFDREVKSLIKVKHENIVRLLGYCYLTEEHLIELDSGTIKAEIRERVLCLEYIRNGSLDSYRADELRGLKWHTRYEIIVGICKGLFYLHKKGIIHMDLKPANILINDLMVPKITDFGLSRLESDNSHTATASRLVSRGYCAPEYLSEGICSSKSDIYCLGVIIIEVVTGRNMPHKLHIPKVLRRWRHRWIKSSNHTPLGYQQVTKCLKLAQRCTEHKPAGRPDISDIMDELDEIDSKDDQFQVIPCLDDMLDIEPLEINFPVEPQQISHTIELTNSTDDYFAFMTKTSVGHLRTEPDKGIVPPRSNCIVTVTKMQAQLKEDEKIIGCSMQAQLKEDEKITVQSTRVDGGLTAMDITKHMFIDTEGDKVVDDVDIMVVFGKPPRAEEF